MSTTQAALSLTPNDSGKDGMFSLLANLVVFFPHFLLLNQLVEITSSFPVCGHSLPSGSGLTLAPIQAWLAAVCVILLGLCSRHTQPRVRRAGEGSRAELLPTPTLGQTSLLKLLKAKLEEGLPPPRSTDKYKTNGTN